MKHAVLVSLVLVCISCKPAQRETPRVAVAAAGPKVRATLVTIETKLQPANKTFTHSIIISGDVARSGDEVDTWRLIDVKAGKVTYVDDLAKTYRSETLQSMLAKRPASEKPVDGAPHAQFAFTPQTKRLQGVTARQGLVRAGAYTRELWIGEHPAIPPTLYSMMIASRTQRSSLASMMEDVDEALLKVRGFPLAEHAELPFGTDAKGKLVVDRNVVRIAQGEVPQDWLRVPAGYKDLTAPAANPPRASSPPAGRSTPAAGSPPSSTSRSNP